MVSALSWYFLNDRSRSYAVACCVGCSSAVAPSPGADDLYEWGAFSSPRWSRIRAGRPAKSPSTLASAARPAQDPGPRPPDRAGSTSTGRAGGTSARPARLDRAPRASVRAPRPRRAARSATLWEGAARRARAPSSAGRSWPPRFADTTRASRIADARTTTAPLPAKKA